MPANRKVTPKEAGSKYKVVHPVSNDGKKYDKIFGKKKKKKGEK